MKSYHLSGNVAGEPLVPLDYGLQAGLPWGHLFSLSLLFPASVMIRSRLLPTAGPHTDSSKLLTYYRTGAGGDLVVEQAHTSVAWVSASQAAAFTGAVSPRSRHAIELYVPPPGDWCRPLTSGQK